MNRSYNDVTVHTDVTVTVNTIYVSTYLDVAIHTEN